MTIDPRTPYNAWMERVGFSWTRQALPRSENVRGWASRMKSELHPAENRVLRRTLLHTGDGGE